MGLFEELPEGCIASILSCTTPADAGRLAVVSKTFRSAADSDAVWNQFLRSDPQFTDFILSHSPPSIANAPTKKALFLALSDLPIITDDGRKSFQLERKSGKKCIMLAARALTIHWDLGDFDEHWNWTAMPDSRFPEVVELLNMCKLGIRGKINTLALSPNTPYATFLVFKMIDGFGFGKENYPVELSIGVVGGHSRTKIVILVDPILECRRLNRILGSEDNNTFRLQRPSMRSDGWLETEMGEFFNSGLEDEEIQMSIIGIKGGYQWKRGFFVEGIEVRPKEDNKQHTQYHAGYGRIWLKI